MCLILFAHQAHPHFPLVVAANRDEFYDRPTAPADFWETSSHLLAGRDLKAGGTWLGLTRDGRFAAITNYRNAENLKRAEQSLLSRGEIVRNFLAPTNASLTTPERYAESLQAIADQYAGFNVLLGDTKQLVCYSNISKEINILEPGIYGLSNDLLDSPWQKVEQGKQKLKKILSQTNESFYGLTHISEQALSVLTSTEIAPDNTLPDTGFSLEKERLLSASFISSDNYGTCCSTAVIINQKNEVLFQERNYPKNSEVSRHLSSEVSNRTFEFLISQPN